MPELPEVETIANGVDARVRGQRIRELWLGSKREPFKSPRPLIVRTVSGHRIQRVHRVGKTIVMQLDTGAEFLIHLGMTGRLLVNDAAADIPPHTHAILHLEDGRDIRFVDPRRFGRLSVVPAGGYAGPGSEPLTISPTDFAALFRRRKTPIKAALLNQKLLHGVGNIYADESLFHAGIRPLRHAGRLTRAELDRLHLALQKVLRNAISLGGSSVSDYVDADGVRGFFQLEHRVYLRTGEPCLVCKTPIRRTTVGGRGTHYCPKCQS